MNLKTFILIFISIYIYSCQSKYYSKEDFKSVLKIDTHVHIDSDRGLFEGEAITDNFKLITICVDVSDSASVNKQLRLALLSKKNFPETVFYTATFHFDTAGWETADWSKKVIADLSKAISAGAVSVKIWKNIGMTVKDKNGKFIMVDNSLIKPVIDFIISKNLPITGHLGEPLNCWLPLNKMTVRGDSSYFAQNPQYHMFRHPEYPSYEEQLNARDHLLELHPDLKFVGCHLGSLEWNVDELAKRLDKYPNMAVDMAARICHLQYQSARDLKKVRDFCIKYQDRLLYGTDQEDSGNPKVEEFTKNLHEVWFEDWKYFTSEDQLTSVQFKGTFQGLHLPREVVDKIYRTNAIRWYSLSVKN
jgi:Amidohydrolase